MKNSLKIVNPDNDGSISGKIETADAYIRAIEEFVAPEREAYPIESGHVQKLRNHLEVAKTLEKNTQSSILDMISSAAERLHTWLEFSYPDTLEEFLKEMMMLNQKMNPA